MRRWAVLIGRMAVTLVVALLALLVARWMWVRYQVEPWTRDGRVRADVVAVSPDVAGFVTRVLVRDDQAVRRGDPLFQLDEARFRVAVQQDEAEVASRRSALAEAEREAARNRALGDLVSTEARQQSVARVEEDRAALDQALAGLAAARLNLERALIRAPVNGVVTNLELRPGDYLTVGRQGLALIDSDTLHVDGYFEETKLPRIHVGDPALVTLMGETLRLHGRVESIAAGIEDRERAPSPNLLPNVNPTFSWVRLAQRVPVRIRLDRVPPSVRLVAGRTASVEITGPDWRRAETPFWRLW